MPAERDSAGDALKTRVHYETLDKRPPYAQQSAIPPKNYLMQPVGTIAVIPQGSTHRYWKAIRAGAEKSAQDLAGRGVPIEINWKGPLREGDHAEQIQILRSFIKARIQGIVLAPFDRVALIRPVEEAADAGIPVVVIDSPLDSQRIVSLIASDNLSAGAMAADRMAALLPGPGTVLLLRERGCTSTEEREQGFVNRLKQVSPRSQVLLPNEYTGPTRDTAKDASERLLTRYIEEVQGVFTTNESSTAGMVMALQGRRIAGKVAFVGFDSSDVYVDAMRYNQLHGLVVQDPFRMGELGVKTIVEHLAGSTVSKRVKTQAMMITPDNMDTPDAKALLNPPVALKRY
jgi:ribose transport system substrate-binding protein